MGPEGVQTPSVGPLKIAATAGPLQGGNTMGIGGERSAGCVCVESEWCAHTLQLCPPAAGTTPAHSNLGIVNVGLLLSSERVLSGWMPTATTVYAVSARRQLVSVAPQLG